MDDADLILTPLSRPLITDGVTRGAWRQLSALGFAAASEVGLPNGRRADFKWQEYWPCCDLFYFAVAPEFPQAVLPDEPGLIVADGFGGAVVRDAVSAPLAGAARKALTLAFARLSAFRAAPF